MKDQVEIEDLRAEVAEKGVRLKSTFAGVGRLSSQVDDFRKQLDLLKIKCAQWEMRVIFAE